MTQDLAACTLLSKIRGVGRRLQWMATAHSLLHPKLFGMRLRAAVMMAICMFCMVVEA